MELSAGPGGWAIVAYAAVETVKFLATRFVQQQNQLRLLGEITAAQKSIAGSLTQMAEMQQSTALILCDLADKVHQDRPKGPPAEADAEG